MLTEGSACNNVLTVFKKAELRFFDDGNAEFF